MTYTVNRAFSEYQPGDVLDAADLSEAEIAYLSQIGAITANDVQTPAARGKTKTAKSEE